MNTVFVVLSAQIVLGALDNLWHHEITKQLAHKRSARKELALHAVREFLYAVIFFGLAWYAWHGAWALVLGLLFIIEMTVTLADFLVEDRTRKLPPFERVLHTILAVNLGVFLALLTPVLWQWWLAPSAMTPIDHGSWSWFLTACAAGVLIWSIRDALVVVRHLRPLPWKRHPIKPGNKIDPRNVLVTGATGFIGSRLCRHLIEQGDRVTVLTCDSAHAAELFGPHVRIVESVAAIRDDEFINAIVNLAGAPIIGLPWFKFRRDILLGSRLRVTRELVRLIARLQVKPEVLVNASAIGFYGISGDEELTETSGPPNILQSRIFQSRLCRLWERMAARAEDHGVRVCRLRLDLVLAGDGGALPQLVLGLRFGVGAILGSGRQWMSWIHIDDVLRIIETTLSTRSLSGPINCTAPNPVRHEHFMREAARVLRRPLLLPVPSWCLRVTLGDMAELFVDGQRVLPQKLENVGFEFDHPHIGPVMDNLLAAKPPGTPTGSLELIYNGSCPVCSVEVAHFDRVATASGCELSLTDISLNPTLLESYGLKIGDVERRLYARDKNGRVHAGVDAGVRLLTELKPYRSLADILRMPGFYGLATLLYEGIHAPTLMRYSAKRRARRSK